MQDVLDYLVVALTNANTDNLGMQPSDIQWIIGDAGSCSPPDLPFAFIAPFNDIVQPGLSSGGPHGVDMKVYTVMLLIAQSRHDFLDPIPSLAGAGWELPGYRRMAQTADNVEAVIRGDITMGGLVAGSTITENRPVPADIGGKLYRCTRIALQIRQRVGR